MAARKARTGLPWVSSPGGLGANAGEGLGLSPTGRRPPRKGSIGICGAWSSEGKGRGPKGSTGEGTPRRDPGGPAGRSRPNGRVGGHQRVTATAATAYLWRRGPAHWTSHGAARPHGASHGTPGRLLGPHYQPRPKGGKERDKCWVDVCVDDCVWAGCVGVTLNSSEDSVPPSFGGGLLLFPRRQKAAGGRGFPFFLPHPSERRLIGLSNDPLPGASAEVFEGVFHLRKSALLCRADAPPTKGRAPAQSAGAPTPAGSRVRVPRPMGDGARYGRGDLRFKGR
jgi:hypothetical protein